jgi:serine/threonine protein kinase
MQSLRGDQNIVELFDAEQHGDSLLLAMTLCDGGTLRDYINTQTPMSNHIELLKIVREITSGLRALRLHDLVRVVVVVVPGVPGVPDCSCCCFLLFSVFVFCILYLFSVFVSY